MDKNLNTVNLSGFFTTQFWLQGRTLREIEQLLGLYTGRLNQGAWFTTVVKLPNPEEFEFAGFSQVAGHRTISEYGTLNNPTTKEEEIAYLKRKMAIRTDVWGLNGDKRLIKVRPMLDHSIMMSDDFQYPPGTGIPQWKIIATHGVAWRPLNFVKDYPNGRFIPDEGYTPVNYGR